MCRYGADRTIYWNLLMWLGPAWEVGRIVSNPIDSHDVWKQGPNPISLGVTSLCTSCFNFVFNLFMFWLFYVSLAYLVKTARSRWMQVASDRIQWKSIGEAYAQQWTVTGWYDDDESCLICLINIVNLFFLCKYIFSVRVLCLN